MKNGLLGPLLFSIYVNDLPAVLQKCISHSYVDDTRLQISYKLQNKDIAVAKINEDLRKVYNWCFRNYLLLKPDKSKAYGVWYQTNATKASRYLCWEGLIT